MKANDYRRGYHDGLRVAITWLHARAREMNDPHAKAILNTAAFHFGVEVAEMRRKFPIAEESTGQESES
ncbi:hypothetical protein Thiowin_04064 [Thiorhodovibrio winogradskyi]|uniref:Uncharacterized protein n=1 Tax=Thiorhodovibrio winogradskyi TaxID=77007 RepID=A0ABZ0SEC7_9GAMM|nr:hypothetical protein [Thiorhodovibrio winogradskyi]